MSGFVLGVAAALFVAAILCLCIAAVYYAKARLALATALAVQADVRQIQADAEALAQRSLDALAVAEEHAVAEEPTPWL